MLHPVASEEVIQTAPNPQRWAVPGQQGLSLGTSEHALLERSSVFGWCQYNLIQLVGKEKPRVRCRSHCPTFPFRERWVVLSIVLSIWHPQLIFFGLILRKRQFPHSTKCHNNHTSVTTCDPHQCSPSASKHFHQNPTDTLKALKATSVLRHFPFLFGIVKITTVTFVLIRFYSFTFPRHLV